MKRSPGEQVSGKGGPAPGGAVDSDYPTGEHGPPGGGPGGRKGELKPGTVLGKYQIVKRLAGGGMGAVYEAVHTGIAKPVALKTVNPALAADPVAATRFLREAAAASRLDHPHVVDVTDFGNDAGVGYLVMELLRGEDLATVISSQPGGLAPPFVADVMLAVCAGVFAAHESGVVHRDLKPQNIFLARTPLGEMVPKVLDFGISKRLDDDRKSLTHSGAVMGTTHYLSPEQVAGKSLDVRSDQYALGVILYEALTGKRPHVGDSAYAIMQSIGEGRFALPRLVRSEIPPGFEAVVVRAMSLRPQDRFESVHGLGRALLPFASSKRRVIWSDYYQQDRPAVTSSPPAGYAKLPLPAVGEEGGTVAIDLKKKPKKSSLANTRTRMALPSERPPPAAPPAPAARPRASDDTGKEVVPVPVIGTDEYMRTSLGRRRGTSRLVMGLGLLIAGGAVYMLWIDPGWRDRLPASLRQRIDRAMPADKRGEQPAGTGLAGKSEPVVETPAVPVTPVTPSKPEGTVVLPPAAPRPTLANENTVPHTTLASETAARPPSPLAPEPDAAPAQTAAADAGVPAIAGAGGAAGGEGAAAAVPGTEGKTPVATAAAEGGQGGEAGRKPPAQGRPATAGPARAPSAVRPPRKRVPPAVARPPVTSPAQQQPPPPRPPPPPEDDGAFPIRPKNSPGGAPILE